MKSPQNRRAERIRCGAAILANDIGEKTLVSPCEALQEWLLAKERPAVLVNGEGDQRTVEAVHHANKGVDVAVADQLMGQRL